MCWICFYARISLLLERFFLFVPKKIRFFLISRSYYKCTQSACEAKKRVQRLGDNPSTFEVTYSGEHTCHMLPKRDSVEVTNAIFGNSMESFFPPADDKWEPGE